MNLDLLSRLAERSVVQVTERSAEIGDCLVWTGYQLPRGHGQVKVDGRLTLVHRAAWIARHGELPSGKPFVLHHCDNPPCWRDEHLYAGTQAQNVADRDRRGRNPRSSRSHCPARHPYSKENTYVDARGWRQCRTCKTARTRAWRARIREEQASGLLV